MLDSCGSRYGYDGAYPHLDELDEVSWKCGDVPALLAVFPYTRGTLCSLGLSFVVLLGGLFGLADVVEDGEHSGVLGYELWGTIAGAAGD